MKTVYSGQEIPHLWAHRTQQSARSSNGTLYFDGDTIYSYGRHFPIARHVEHKGKRAVLFTTDSYSVTTSKHISMVRRAIPEGVPVFHVSMRPTLKTGEQAREYRAQIGQAAASAERARSTWRKECLAGRAFELAEEANAFAEFYGLKSRVNAADVEGLRRVAEQRAAEAREQGRRKREAEDKRKAEHLAKWLSGETDAAPYTSKDYLRVAGDDVQTSQGVSVPREHAKRLYEFAKLVRERGEGWEANGHTLHVGVFKVERIEKDGAIVAGCHRIEWAEAERVGVTL